MRTCAVVPVKRFDDAKQRLDKALSAGSRRALAEAMVTDVLTALRRAQLVEAVVVVTGEHSATALARAHGAQAIGDDDRGHSHAARSGVDWALEQGFERVLLVPGDCPTLDPGQLDELIGGGMEAPDVTVVPDRHGTGTNALLLTPPDVIAPSFGPGSRERHEQAAAAAGARARIAQPRSLVLDVDTADDLAVLHAAFAASTGGAAHTRGLLARLARR
ncbi:MAG: 2-phospho-L-lactate/phosphoenolpyruvate guanylyltransferase [Solirubrobacteraceae bacterium]|jgi:2-phospho-L-lactate guanylyltransferase|nr:2-phospho-L-lactate/phosphoenolpyruvate guanylyltransferase [Solirubrobacteraceae bacterium]